MSADQIWRLPEVLSIIADNSSQSTLQSLRAVNRFSYTGAQLAWKKTFRSLTLRFVDSAIAATARKVAQDWVKDLVQELIIILDGLEPTVITRNRDHLISIFSNLRIGA